jgi:hypothetical protein
VAEGGSEVAFEEHPRARLDSGAREALRQALDAGATHGESDGPARQRFAGGRARQVLDREARAADVVDAHAIAGEAGDAPVDDDGLHARLREAARERRRRPRRRGEQEPVHAALEERVDRALLPLHVVVAVAEEDE